MRTRGFTMTEIVMAVAMLATFSLLAVVSYSALIGKTSAVSVQQPLAAAHMAFDVHRDDRGFYPRDPAEANAYIAGAEFVDSHVDAGNDSISMLSDGSSVTLAATDSTRCFAVRFAYNGDVDRVVFTTNSCNADVAGSAVGESW